MAVARIEATWLMFKDRQRYLALRGGAVVIQAYMRRFLARKRFRGQIDARIAHRKRTLDDDPEKRFEFAAFAARSRAEACKLERQLDIKRRRAAGLVEVWVRKQKNVFGAWINWLLADAEGESPRSDRQSQGSLRSDFVGADACVPACHRGWDQHLSVVGSDGQVLFFFLFFFSHSPQQCFSPCLVQDTLTTWPTI